MFYVSSEITLQPSPFERMPLKQSPPSWFLYLIRTRTGTLYTGITTNVAQRLKAHVEGKQGAKYLRSKGPLELVYQVEIGNKSVAYKAEYRLKRLTKRKKETIVSEQPDNRSLLSLLNVEFDE